MNRPPTANNQERRRTGQGSGEDARDVASRAEFWGDCSCASYWLVPLPLPSPDPNPQHVVPVPYASERRKMQNTNERYEDEDCGMSHTTDEQVRAHLMALSPETGDVIEGMEFGAICKP
jgi:hypothetical protein